MFLNFKRTRSPSTDDRVGHEKYEEIGEKRTTIAGYFLLFLMSAFLVAVGEQVFTDVRQIPALPQPPAQCIARTVGASAVYAGAGNVRNGVQGTLSDASVRTALDKYRASTCTFSDTDRAAGIPAAYAKIEPRLQTISDINQEISSLTQAINKERNTLRQLERQYELSLQEKTANERVLYSPAEYQQQIADTRSRIENLEANMRVQESGRDQVVPIILSEARTLGALYEASADAFYSAMAWYRVKVFGLMLLFIIPLFSVALHRYFALKRKNSPYTIIATAVLVASGILLLQTVLVFLYDILPRKWIEYIFSIFAQIVVLRYVLYYGVAALVVLLFGGIVYVIQRRIFDPKRIAVRRLKDNKCPNCSFALHQTQSFCPKCGRKVREHCAACNAARLIDMPFCPSCGNGTMSSQHGDSHNKVYGKDKD